MGVRPADKAGIDEENYSTGWYSEDPVKLEAKLDDFIGQVPDTINDSSLPIPGARVVIAPHAGYKYSGKCAAWAYKALDLSKAKRVFVLGPVHVGGVPWCGVTTYDEYATPFGNLVVDKDTTQRVKEAAELEDVPASSDKNEHSLEMHMPYLYYRFKQTFGSPENFPLIIPIFITSISRAEEKQIGQALAPYFKDEENAFVISSDFCHWGWHFQFLRYAPDGNIDNAATLRGSALPTGIPIHEYIRRMDESAMDAVESGSHDGFVSDLRKSRNTVCGRHPIGVTLAALELLANEAGDPSKYRFKIAQYDRSKLVVRPSDESVSYVSAYAIM